MLEPYQEVHMEIEELKLLDPNWNSYGAPAIDRKCIAKAQKYLLLLARRGAPPPEGTIPTSFGGVELYWKAEDFMVEFNPSTPWGAYTKEATSVSFEVGSKEDMELATQLLSVLSNMQLDDIVEGVH